MKRIKVAFPLVNESWTGGFNYITNLVHAIKQLPERKIEPVLLVSTQLKKKVHNNFQDLTIIETSLLSGFGLLRIFSKILEFLFKKNILLEKLLNKHDIKVLSHAIPLGLNSSTITICWIPDFQHFRLPKFFSKKLINKRNKIFRRIIKDSNLILLSSLSAQNDLREYEPKAIVRSKVLNFISGSIEKKPPVALQELQTKYKFLKPFFYLPNQFWIHKNHKLVIDALIELDKNNHLNFNVICTGSNFDFRYPGYLDELKMNLSDSGQDKNFYILGMIPYKEAMSLMHYSIAVINPSLFEGWSTSVEEAKACGKTILLSNIPAHKEQKPSRAIYFSPNSPVELANSMKLVFNKFNLMNELNEKKKAQTIFKKNFLKFGYDYQNIVLDLIDNK
jgi:glycosyltransferase involved in cell wall biosynthesis